MLPGKATNYNLPKKKYLIMCSVQNDTSAVIKSAGKGSAVVVWDRTAYLKKEARGRSTRYSDRLHDFSVTIPRCYKDVYVNSFFPHTAKLWRTLPIEFFPSTYYLNSFKCRINRHLLTVGSF